ncbi:hypothetical protein GCM10017744_001160 [Streptomyces antimycoticus]|uniref:Uncharacterized protein n=1 Tax=Streptomyces antimycoticus TaxID=68175 RepID=A0A4D4KQX7_9ACTN|nr:hypothetical protein SANT12839_098520 [Streptomyces antimycoticus]
MAVQLAHVDVQDRGAGVVAVDRRLHVLIHGEREVVGVTGQPLRPIGRGLDDQLLLVLRVQGVIEERSISFVGWSSLAAPYVTARDARAEEDGEDRSGIAGRDSRARRGPGYDQRGPGESMRPRAGVPLALVRPAVSVAVRQR